MACIAGRCGAAARGTEHAACYHLDGLEILDHLVFLEGYNKKTRGDIIADITSLRGRLPAPSHVADQRRGDA